MSTGYTIRSARPEDLPYLAAIELAAAKLLEGHAASTELAAANLAAELATTIYAGELEKAQLEGRLWVACAAATPVGFAFVKHLPSGLPHLEEIDVHPDHGRRGVGARLVQAVLAWVRDSGHPSITLTTFRSFPWNMRFYAKEGFEVVPSDKLSGELRDLVEHETARGLEAAQRVVMRYSAP